jgi:acyl dehydratase
VTAFASLEQLRAAAGTDLGVSDWVSVTPDQVARFVAATGDPDAMYLPLALSNRLMPALIEVPAASLGVNYGTGRVRFPARLRPGARVRAKGRLVACDEIPGGVQTTILVTVEAEGEPEPVCEIESLSRWLA